MTAGSVLALIKALGGGSGGGGGGSSGGGAFIVKLTAQNTPGSFTSDKKASEIFNAAKTTPIVVIWDDSANEEYPDFICFVFCEAYIDNGEYGFTLFDLANFAPMTSTGNSANDYPVFSIQG